MKLPERKTLIKYCVSAGLCVLFVWIYLSNYELEYGAFAQQTKLVQLRLLCDCFTIPGLLMLLSGLLMTVANEGALDGLGYLGHYMYHMFIPGMRGSTKRYGDYVASKREKRVRGFGFLYVIGGICMAFALVFYAMYKLSA